LDIPRLETERLILRAHRLEDFAECAAMWADPSVTHFIGKPSTEQEAWARLLNYAGLWSLLGFGYWAVEEKATGRYIGDVGFADFKRDIQPSLREMPELGWVLAARAHGHGYATEAVRAALAWGDGNFGGRRAACIIKPEHARSIRVAEKCGFKEFRRTTYKDAPTIVFVR
jgi:RimJ/RimL family protein N-acetyltransferase